MGAADNAASRPESVLRVAAALVADGHPNAVFPLAPGDLRRLTGAPAQDVTASAP